MTVRNIGIVFVFACTFILSSMAHAQSGGIESCGNIYIEAGANCEVVLPEAGCSTRCTPIAVQASCAADLQVTCEGQCDIDASLECTGSCQGGCEASCMVDPGQFDCQANCELGCSADCTATCQLDANSAQCNASCRANCGASCNGLCDIVPPSADCSARCEASCSGGCEAEANVDCQVMCQRSGYVDCTATVTGGCETQCQAKEGALFCDGQYVDHGGNLDMCVKALRNLLNIEVEGYADASCTGASCEAEAGGSVSCMAAGGPFGILSIACVGLFGFLRRRKN